MLLPLMVADPKGRAVKNKYWWWLGTMVRLVSCSSFPNTSSQLKAYLMQFLTNVVFLPYVAVRETAKHFSPDSTGDPRATNMLPGYEKYVGYVAGCVAVASAYWAVGGRPEFGGLGERWLWAMHAFSTNRVFYAFVLDTALYTAWQAMLMRAAGAPRRLAYVPFVGAVAWLAGAGSVKAKAE